MDLLPDELIIKIFEYFSLEKLIECENVCDRWKKLARDSSIWRNKIIIYSGKPGQTEVSEKNLEVITTHGEFITCLKLQYVYNFGFLLSILEKCTNLISLELVMCRISVEMQDMIVRWPTLKKINFKNSLILQNNTDILFEFNKFQHLNYLALSDFGLSTDNFQSLLACKYLSHIFIEKIKNLHMDDVKSLILSKQKNLESLHIYGGDSIDDKCIHLLEKCVKLKDLAIIRCESLTDDGLLAIAGFTQLDHLQIWNNVHFSELALLSTLGCPSLFRLNSLSLSRISNISPLIVDIISEYYKGLKFLALYQCPRIINTDYEKQLKSKFRNIDVVLY